MEFVRLIATNRLGSICGTDPNLIFLASSSSSRARDSPERVVRGIVEKVSGGSEMRHERIRCHFQVKFIFIKLLPFKTIKFIHSRFLLKTLSYFYFHSQTDRQTDKLLAAGRLTIAITSTWLASLFLPSNYYYCN